MVIALFALSLVMIVGGAAAVVQGFPYVRLESGLAMVIGGTTAASAGAVLLGIAAAILQMKRLAGALGHRGDATTGEVAFVPPPGKAGPAPSVPEFRAPAFEATAPVATEPATATAGAAGLAGISLGGMRDLLGSGDDRSTADPQQGRSMEIEPPLPNLLPPAASGESISPDEDLFASPGDRPGHGPRAAADALPENLADASPDDARETDPAQEELALRPSLDGPSASSEPEVEPPAVELPPAPLEEPAEQADEPKSEALQVVGTYASGANTYVMFANGTIQADTPRGQFTFQSLDELKQFVDSGGEANARGAA
ncbi:hypothetical protein [Methylobacterium thuringiense]|uniref:DUF308 domain-containing protein n=1 Tax=Methylobacterium thuringiense TaxID=1003091 RepID=A0ABQ4TUH3_9HYPH|nr:hypothetical protein [Methylobacterium thuringiense]GJE57275.1 hypothetical protein EKPJFOCH_3789 [Methylobacterium thuringiense]